MSELLFDIFLYTTKGVPHTHLLATTEGVDEFFRDMALTYKSADTLYRHEVVVTVRPHIDESEAHRLQVRLDEIERLAHGD
jgi:hypothetical protein